MSLAKRYPFNFSLINPMYIPCIALQFSIEKEMKAWMHTWLDRRIAISTYTLLHSCHRPAGMRTHWHAHLPPQIPIMWCMYICDILVHLIKFDYMHRCFDPDFVVPKECHRLITLMIWFKQCCHYSFQAVYRNLGKNYLSEMAAIKLKVLEWQTDVQPKTVKKRWLKKWCQSVSSMPVSVVTGMCFNGIRQ